ncbi:MAG: hypothetical protein QOG53_3067 [Frankiales bacterium]|jgi:hypothetical protein|nr:hypothetical protein [Frankiales bacterium]
MRRLAGHVTVAVAVLLPSTVALAGSAPGPVGTPFGVARDAAPVVLTGASLPTWSRLAAQGLAEPYPSGAKTTGDAKRTAHNGRLVVPPDSRAGVSPDQIAAYRWVGGKWVEAPVQVDQRFPNFLANGRSDFSTYSGTDEELTYAWAPDQHAVGEEAWKKVFGDCSARYANSIAEVNAALASGVAALGPGETPDSFLRAMQDPVPTLDDDDEITFMARDAGATKAPAGVPAPANATSGQVVTLRDPLQPAATRYMYLFLKPGGSTYTAANSPYVTMKRAADADEWIDRYSYGPADTEKVGTSNTGYGFNIPGTVCRTSPSNDANPPITASDGQSRPSTDRFPRDGMTVSTPTYTLSATGRWMVRSLAVTRPKTERQYGPDLIARWKGRAFQQSPDSTVSVVGFEDEQVNWEGNSALLGWRAGPVRAMREIWGADSGTNVTKTETYYRDADVFSYHVRVHPIPPDGLYTSWDYNPGAVTKYYNPTNRDGVNIDGVNDDVGNIDSLPGSNDPAFFDTCDPTFDVCSAVNRPEEVAGPNGGLVYVFELTSPTIAAGNAAAVPYYRDDACIDDGTGDAPVQRPWPGEPFTDQRVKDGYVDYWKAHGAPSTLTYSDLTCNPTAPASTPAWKRMPFQGAIGQHGLHFFVTQDSDNLFGPKSVDEVDGQQWRFSVPMSAPRNVTREYAYNVDAKLVATAKPY